MGARVEEGDRDEGVEGGEAGLRGLAIGGVWG